MLEKQHLSNDDTSLNAVYLAFLIPSAFLVATLWSLLPGKPRLGSFRRVDLTNYRKMDPHMLLGLINTELRNNCDSLDDLVKTHDLDNKSLVEKLGKAGYVYKPEQNQFR